MKLLIPTAARLFLAVFLTVYPYKHIAHAPVLPGQCSIWTLKSYREAGEPAPQVGNFAAITLYADPKGVTGGQSTWVQLGSRELDFIKSLPDNLAQWGWADGEDGKIYRGSDFPATDASVNWPRIALASAGGYRNEVCVTERSPQGGYVRIAGIPKSDDYSAYADVPWLVQDAYTVYPDGHTGPNSLFRMPLFDPDSGFKASAGERGLWMESRWLYEKRGDVQIPWIPPSPAQR